MNDNTASEWWIYEVGAHTFGARHYSSTLGRFLTPDWSATPEPVPYADLENPQSLNLYSYVGNNPVSETDPDGHLCCFGWLGSAFKFASGVVDDTAGQFFVGFGNLFANNKPKGAVQLTLSMTIAVLPEGEGAETAVLAIKSAESAKVADESLPEIGAFNSWVNTTRPGASVTNITTNASADDVKGALLKSGFTQTVSKDGGAIIFTDSQGAQYILRPSNTAPGGVALDFKLGGSASSTLKINLGGGGH